MTHPPAMQFRNARWPAALQPVAAGQVPAPRKQSAAGRSHAQLRHLSGEFVEHLVDRFCKLLRILFRIIA